MSDQKSIPLPTKDEAKEWASQTFPDNNSESGRGAIFSRHLNNYYKAKQLGALAYHTYLSNLPSSKIPKLPSREEVAQWAREPYRGPMWTPFTCLETYDWIISKINETDMSQVNQKEMLKKANDEYKENHPASDKEGFITDVVGFVMKRKGEYAALVDFMRNHWPESENRIPPKEEWQKRAEADGWKWVETMNIWCKGFWSAETEALMGLFKNVK